MEIPLYKKSFCGMNEVRAARVSLSSRYSYLPREQELRQGISFSCRVILLSKHGVKKLQSPPEPPFRSGSCRSHNHSLRRRFLAAVIIQSTVPDEVPHARRDECIMIDDSLALQSLKAYLLFPASLIICLNESALCA